MKVTAFFALVALLTLNITSFGANHSEARFLPDAVEVESLRDLGAEGLEILMNRYKTEIDEYKNGRTPERWAEISEQIDKVAAQKDAYSSGLYWYRSLTKAKRSAAKEGKSILSLRLLGNLDDEYSCANSRFFRSFLYSDPQIQRLIREKFVLHWSSERPAPKITIDFGDGRKLVRTITGNSVHYVIKADGEVIDALPGLYSPKRFLDEITRSANQASRKTNGARLRGVYRAATSSRLLREWSSEIRKKNRNRKPQAQPTRIVATDAAPLAVTKMVTELPTLLSMENRYNALKLETETNDWQDFAKSLSVEFSENSLALMRRKTENLSQTEFETMISRLKRHVAIDTVQNEYELRPRILQRLGNKRVVDFNALNEWVYSNVFLTPGDDPWLGLYEKDIYYAIRKNGTYN